jgi:hypothetical protein
MDSADSDRDSDLIILFLMKQKGSVRTQNNIENRQLNQLDPPMEAIVKMMVRFNPVHAPNLVIADHMNKVTEETISSAVKSGEDQQGKD